MMKRIMVLALLSLALVGCGSKGDTTTCTVESTAGDNTLKFTYVFNTREGMIEKETRTILMTYNDEETAKASMESAEIGEEKGDGYTSVIKKLDDKSISSTLSIDYTKVTETSAALLGLEAVDGNYSTGSLEDTTTFLQTMFPDMTCKAK